MLPWQSQKLLTLEARLNASREFALAGAWEDRRKELVELEAGIQGAVKREILQTCLSAAAIARLHGEDDEEQEHEEQQQEKEEEEEEEEQQQHQQEQEQEQEEQQQQQQQQQEEEEEEMEEEQQEEEQQKKQKEEQEEEQEEVVTSEGLVTQEFDEAVEPAAEQELKEEQDEKMEEVVTSEGLVPQEFDEAVEPAAEQELSSCHACEPLARLPGSSSCPSPRAELAARQAEPETIEEAFRRLDLRVAAAIQAQKAPALPPPQSGRSTHAESAQASSEDESTDAREHPAFSAGAAAAAALRYSLLASPLMVNPTDAQVL